MAINLALRSGSVNSSLGFFHFMGLSVPLRSIKYNTVELEKLMPDLQNLVREAGKELMRIYRKEGDVAVELKEDDSPVTIADLRSNRILVDGLKKLDENIPIVSEENKEIPWEVRQSFEYFWIIDPLDGTKEFIQELDEFTIHLALIHKTKVVLGIIYAPVHDKMYYAWEGGGAWLNTNGKNTRLSGHEVDFTQSGIRILRSRSNLDPKTMEYIRNFKNPELITLGSGLKFVQLITGQADYYPRAKTYMKEWDIAPAQIILEEAGGGIYEWSVDEPLDYNKEHLTIKGFRAVSRRDQIGELPS